MRDPPTDFIPEHFELLKQRVLAEIEKSAPAIRRQFFGYFLLRCAAMLAALAQQFLER